MKKSVVFSVFLFLTAPLASTVWAVEDVIVNPNAAVKFAELPAGVPFPEGITADPAGNIYVSTFIFGSGNKVLKFNAMGVLQAQADFNGEPLLGLAYNSRDNKIYICNAGILNGFGPSRIQRIDTNLVGPAEDVAIIASVAGGGGGIGAPPDRTVVNPDTSVDTITFGNFAAAPNAITFNSRGDAFVSDSFQGAIFRINRAHACNSATCTVTTVAHDPLLATAGFPPFGANGLVLSGNQQTLTVANTGDDRLLTVDISSGAVSVFIESINGADGVTRDAAGNYVVAANQADNVLILDGTTGRIKAKLGDFLGFNPGGWVNGLLFPASVVVVGSNIFVTNLAFPLAGTPDEPEGSSALTTYTVSKIPIPAGL
jgi:sugar lactone lactonase YvrE